MHGIDLNELDQFFATAPMPVAARAKALEDRRRATAVYANGNNLEHAWEIVQLLLNVRAMFQHVVPMATAEAGRKKQVRKMQASGAAASRKYTDEDRARWRAIHQAELTQHSNHRAAAIICAREGLPVQAIDTIRREL